MPERILLISPEPDANRSLVDRLRAKGFILHLTDRLTSPQERQQPPALCLVDLQLSRVVTAAEWESWLSDCQALHVACLGFDRGKLPDRSLLSRLEPLGEVLVDPDDHRELEARLNSLRTIRRLHRQLEETRHQLAAYQSELQEALLSAAHIQNSMIPARYPVYHNLHYAWRFLPSKKVGGDLFNVLRLDEQTVMTYLVDVSGHGISSAMVTVSVHQSLSMHTGQLIKRVTEREPFYEIASPRQVLNELEREYPFERFDEFFTISYLLLDPDAGAIRYANAGHPPPLLLRKNGTIERLDHGGTVVGLGAVLEITEGTAQLGPGDRLFLYTDGITEHVNLFAEPFGEERLCEALSAGHAGSLDAACERVVQALQSFGDEPPRDDVTLIGIEFLPDSAGPTPAP